MILQGLKLYWAKTKRTVVPLLQTSNMTALLLFLILHVLIVCTSANHQYVQLPTTIEVIAEMPSCSSFEIPVTTVARSATLC